MNSFIETLNQWGGIFLNFAWPMFWQSSLLIAVLFAFDYLFRRKVRASIRYALWLVVLVKLFTPPTLALPTSPAWWLHQTSPPVVAKPAPHYNVTYDNGPLPETPQAPLPAFVPPKPAMIPAAWLLIVSAAVSLALLGWLLVRWWQITRQVRHAKTSEQLAALANEAQIFISTKFNLQVKLTTNSMSPAVCGLFRPTILIPQSLVKHFSDGQLRAVLLHELIHLRRRDVWLNFVQALLQIAYWWHPLVWLANARIRRVREEAVDDAVMLSLRDDAESYAPTLLEVAKLALNRPLASLGLVGILESRHALRQRIERLVDFHPPRKAGLTLVSLLGILAFTAVAVPMGDGPSPAEPQALSVSPTSTPAVIVHNTNAASMTVTGILSDPNFRGAIKALEQKTGSETLPEPEVTTRSGHHVNWIGTDNISAPLSQPASEPSNQTAMIFKLEHPIHEDELKEKLLAAGVKIPPTVFFYQDYGRMLACSSPEQLTLVEHVVRKLNGYPSKKSEANTEQFIRQMSDIGFKEPPISPVTNLLSRHFRVNTKSFVTGLRKATGSQTDNISTMARSFFSTLGVDLELPGKSVFFNDGMGELFVRATATDLDTVETALEVFLPPQLHIKARFLEVPKESLALLHPFPELTNGVTILSDASFRKLMQTLESNPGTETLAEPEVVTTTGRQTQMRATVLQTVLTNYAFEQTIVHSTTNGMQQIVTNNAIFPQTSQIETGPIIDMVPYVLSNGHTINLTTTFSLTEFLGYDQPPTNAVGQYIKESDVTLPVVLPSFHVQQVHTQVNLWDNQTVVLGKLQQHFYVGGKEIGAEPDYFVETKKSRGQPDVVDKELLVFITMTLVDQAGNRIHSDEEAPADYYDDVSPNAHRQF